jgi:hypothetical protein
MGVVIGEEFKKIMATCVKYPPRKQQSLTYTGPITLSNYEKLQYIRDSMAQDGISLPMPTEN